MHHHLTLPEATDLAQNRPLWRMMSMYGATQSELHARNDDDDDGKDFQFKNNIIKLSVAN